MGSPREPDTTSATERHGSGSRDGRDMHMTDSRTNDVKPISDRISQAHYEVNSSAVAQAILDRLLSGNLLPNELRR